MEQVELPPLKRKTSMVQALYSRNFRLFFFGQGISLIGTWLQSTAMSWLVYRLTGSARWLGLVGFASQIPAFIAMPWAGVVVDRVNRHRLILWTQALSMLQALLLALTVLMGTVTVGQILVLGAFLGLINAFDIPARQAFLIEMVDKREDLANAIALNSAAFNATRLVGPAIAGLLIATVGEGLCFALNGLSFLAVLATLLAMKRSPTALSERQNPRGRWHEFKEGLAVVWHTTPIRSVLILVALVNFVGVPSLLLMPIFAKDVFHGGPLELGWLTGATGAGALLGALAVAARKSQRGLEQRILLAACFMGAGLITFALSKTFLLALICLALAGFGMITQMACSNIFLQTAVEDNKRGRVMSFYGMAFVGMVPLGSLLAGDVAARVGAPTTLLLAGALCVASSLVLYRSVRPRPAS